MNGTLTRWAGKTKNVFSRAATAVTEVFGKACALAAGALLVTELAVVRVMADTDITTMVSDASTLWDAVKIVLISIIGFTLLLTVVRLVRKRA